MEAIPLRMLELARSHPREPVALDALTQAIGDEYWITAYTDHSGWGQDSPAAAVIVILLRDHLNSDKPGDACKRAVWFPSGMRGLSPHCDGKKPFALLGANGMSPDPKKLKAVMEKENLNWRTFADAGAVSATWSAWSTPAYYLLDPKGVIRNKWLGYPGVKALDTAVESLLNEK